MILGFTGTREGMSTHQRKWVCTFLLYNTLITEFHHGDCIGADKEAHDLVASFENIAIVIHPPTNDKYRANCSAEIILPPADYLVRNRDIVDASDLMIATPRGYDEELRSGTWAAVRYARRRGMTIHLILPNGRDEYANA